MKTIGFFKELGLYADNGSIRDYLTDETGYDKVGVINYLKNNRTVALSPALLRDPLNEEHHISGFNVITDGEYEWGDFLVYFIQNYNIRLPEEFLQRIYKAA